MVSISPTFLLLSEMLSASIYKRPPLHSKYHQGTASLEMADALLQSVHAVHTVDFSEYINSVRAMLPWMLAYDKDMVDGYQTFGLWF